MRQPPFFRSATFPIALAFTGLLSAATFGQSEDPPGSIEPILEIPGTAAVAPGYLRVHVQLWQGDQVLKGERQSMDIYSQLGSIQNFDELGQALDRTEMASHFDAFLDTGASGHVISKSVAERYNVKAEPNAVYHETGLHGPIAMGVSEPYLLALEGARGMYGQPKDAFRTVQQRVRFQLKQQKPSNPVVEMTLGGINIVGMPAIERMMVQIDSGSGSGERKRHREAAKRLEGSAEGTDGAFGQLDQLLDQMEGLETLGGPTVRLHGPNHQPDSIDVVIPLDYVDYARRQNPKDQGPIPTLAANPTIQNIDSHTDDGTFTGRWLVDTGSPASMISNEHARALGLVNEQGEPTRRPDFTLPLGGVSGRSVEAPGFAVDEVIVPTAQGVMRYHDVPVVVHDISTTLDEGREVTLDGVFGLNLIQPGNSQVSQMLAGLAGIGGLGGAGRGGGGGGGTQDGPRLDSVWIDGPRGRLLLDQAEPEQ
jgi:hypothetical protein